MTEPQNLLVVDLDGTYIRGNTLHIYLRCALRHHLRRGHLHRVLGIFTMLALRKLHLISHVQMKFSALRMAGRQEALMHCFKHRVNKLVNPDVQQLIEDYARQGYGVLLATAAADFYVPTIWHGDFVATKFSDNPRKVECRGQEKLQAVLDFSAAHGCRIAAVVTDHSDDMPLMLANPGHNHIIKN